MAMVPGGEENVHLNRLNFNAQHTALPVLEKASNNDLRTQGHNENTRKHCRVGEFSDTRATGKWQFPKHLKDHIACLFFSKKVVCITF